MEQILPDGTIFIQAAVFVIALVVIKSFILNPISGVLKGRAERIEGAEQEAVRLELESTTLDLQYKKRIREARSKAQELRNQRRQEALAAEKEILDKGRQDAQTFLLGIREDIRRETADANTQLKRGVAALSQALAEKILGRPLP